MPFNCFIIIFDFEHIFLYNGTIWADYTHSLQWTRHNGFFTILDAADSEVRILSHKKFEGLDIRIASSDLVATAAFEYSQGLTQGGRVTWSAPSDWHKTDIEDVGTLDDVTDVFAIRIRLTAYTSGSVNVRRVS